MQLDPAVLGHLLSVFLSEAEPNLGVLVSLAERMRAPPVGAETLAEFGRVAHGLKGAAASLGIAGMPGFDGLARRFHTLEDVALGLRRCAGRAYAARYAAMRTALSLLRDGIADIAAAGEAVCPQSLLDDLEKALASCRSGPTDEAPDGEIEDVAGPAEEPHEARTVTAGALAEAAETVADRLTVSAQHIDEALRGAAWVTRGLASLNDRVPDDSELSRVVHELRSGAEHVEELLFGVRLVPGDAALTGIDLEVTDLAARIGKTVSLRVRGSEVRADRRTLQNARTMLRHLIRNSLDHGIEPPADRERAGKPARALLTISLEMLASTLAVTVADDGRGFDVGAIRARNRAAGRDDSASTDEEVLERFACEGGSTRDSVTEVSGRGMGLSAVARIAKAAGGGIQIRSEKGRGSVVRFTLPLEVYSAEVLTFHVGPDLYAFPLTSLDGVVSLAYSGAALHRGPAGATLAFAETIVPVMDAGAALHGEETRAPRFAVVVRSESRAVALLVDDLGAMIGVVPTPVGAIAGEASYVVGVGHLADGRAISVLSANAIVEAVRASPRSAVDGGDPGARRRAAERPARALEVLLVEDSLATREVLRVLLEQQGHRVRTAGDGQEALERIREAVPDLVLSDVNMPRLDGLGLLRAIRADPALARVPVLLLTSQDDARVRAEGLAAGADAYLIKSKFNASLLQETLTELGVCAE